MITARTQSLGMIAMLASCAAFAGLDALAKSVSDTLPGFEIAFLRVAFSWPFIALLVWRQGLQSIQTNNVHLHGLRAVIQAGSMLLFFTGLATTPLAQVVAIEFMSPLIAVVLAVILYREQLPLRRILALAAGVGGLLIALRPGVVDVGHGQVLVLISAACWAGTILVVRLLGRTESSTSQVFYVAVFLTPINGIAAASVWVTPSWGDLGVMFLAAGMGTIALWLYGEALRLADLTAVMPLDFTKILWASLFGWLFFAEQPDVWTLLGGLVIFGAAVLLTSIESRSTKPEVPTSID